MIAIGFYTPDYAALAHQFRADCIQHDIDSKLYEVLPEAWTRAILLKPSILQKARQEFPDESIALFDIDCRIHGPIAPIFDLPGDIALHQRCKLVMRRRVKRATVWPSTRVVVVRPTKEADFLLAAWRQACAAEAEKPDPYDDELLLAYAISQTPGVSISMLPDIYAAHEFDEAPDGAVIVHHSAHDRARKSVTFWRGVKVLRRKAVSALTGRDYATRKYQVSK